MEKKNNTAQQYGGGAIQPDQMLPDTNQALQVLNDPANFKPQWERLVKEGMVTYEKFNNFLNTTVKKSNRKFKIILAASAVSLGLVVTFAEPVAFMAYQKQSELMQSLNGVDEDEIANKADEMAFLKSLPVIEAKNLPKLSEVKEVVAIMEKGLIDEATIPDAIEKGVLFKKDGRPSYKLFTDSLSKGAVLTAGVFNGKEQKTWAVLVFRVTPENKVSTKIYRSKEGLLRDANGSLVDGKSDRVAELKAQMRQLQMEANMGFGLSYKEERAKRKEFDKLGAELNAIEQENKDLMPVIAATEGIGGVKSFYIEESPMTAKTLFSLNKKGEVK